MHSTCGRIWPHFDATAVLRGPVARFLCLFPGESQYRRSFLTPVPIWPIMCWWDVKPYSINQSLSWLCVPSLFTLFIQKTTTVMRFVASVHISQSACLSFFRRENTELISMRFFAVMYYQPSYLANDCEIIADSGRRCLRSVDDTIRSRCSANLHSARRQRSFSVAAPKLWNSLPAIPRHGSLLTFWRFTNRIIIIIIIIKTLTLNSCSSNEYC